MEENNLFQNLQPAHTWLEFVSQPQSYQQWPTPMQVVTKPGGSGYPDTQGQQQQPPVLQSMTNTQTPQDNPMWVTTRPRIQDFVHQPGVTSNAFELPAKPGPRHIVVTDAASNLSQGMKVSRGARRLSSIHHDGDMPYGQRIVMKMQRENAAGVNGHDKQPVRRTQKPCHNYERPFSSFPSTALVPSKLQICSSAEHKRSYSAMSNVYRVKVHIQSATQPEVKEGYVLCHLVDDAVQHELVVQPPAEPKTMQETMRRMIPIISYVQYACPEQCHSRGICVHMSFVLGCRSTPDGLICQVCRSSGKKEATVSSRICPRHNKEGTINFCSNLLEDILASPEQMQKAEEYWRRAWNNEWDNLTKKPTLMTHSDVHRDVALPSVERAEDGSALHRDKRRRLNDSFGHEDDAELAGDEAGASREVVKTET